MPAIRQFGGIVPRKAWHLLSENEATMAHDVKLRNGRLEAWRERKAVAMTVDEAKSFYVKGCCYLSWDKCVTVADYVTDYGRMFVTGHADKPEVMVLDGCEPEYLYLGVPEPTTAPVASGTTANGRDCAQRSYVYTYVNVFGEESAPSPVSNTLTVCDGTAVTISGLARPPEGWGITEIWLYRTATGYRDESSKEQDMVTDFLKVAEFSADVSSYTDRVKDMSLGSVNDTREVRVPPQALREIQYLRGTGILAGVRDNTVHFTMPYQPYNWPAENDMTLPYNIIHARAIGDKLIISTDGYPYVIDAANQCESRKCKPANDVDIPLPDIACGYEGSAIATPFGMFYVSKDGIVLVQINTQFQIVTKQWFSTDDWIKLEPMSIRMAYWRGYLVFVSNVASFMLEIDAEPYGDVHMGALTTISDTPVDLFSTTSGELLMMDADRLVYQWNAGNKYRPYLWQSREITTGYKTVWTTAMVRCNGSVDFKLLTERPDVYYDRTVVDDNPFRLGRIGRNLNYRIEISGIHSVDFVELGTSMMTINAGG